jgi:hypothetical protein
VLAALTELETMAGIPWQASTEIRRDELAARFVSETLPQPV